MPNVRLDTESEPKYKKKGGIKTFTINDDNRDNYTGTDVVNRNTEIL